MSSRICRDHSLDQQHICILREEDLQEWFQFGIHGQAIYKGWGVDPYKLLSCGSTLSMELFPLVHCVSWLFFFLKHFFFIETPFCFLFFCFCVSWLFNCLCWCLDVPDLCWGCGTWHAQLVGSGRRWLLAMHWIWACLVSSRKRIQGWQQYPCWQWLWHSGLQKYHHGNQIDHSHGGNHGSEDYSLLMLTS